MMFADRVKVTTTATSTVTVTLGAAVLGGLTIAQATLLTVGMTGVPFCVDDGAGKWELANYTVTSLTLLTRETILASTNGGAAESFGAGTKTVAHVFPAAVMNMLARSDAPAVTTLTNPTTAKWMFNDGGAFKQIAVADFFAQFGQTGAQLADAGAIVDGDYIPVVQSGVEKKATAAAWKAYTGIGAASATVATAITLTGPAGGAVSTASTNFTVGVTPVGGAISGTITVTPSDNGGGGSFTPTSVGLTSAAPTATFTYTPSSTAGARTISVTNNVGLTNPSSITYTSTGGAATVPATMAAPVITAGDGSISIAWVAPANGGSAILDATFTASTGQTATGASSPTTMTVPNGTAVTVTGKARNAVGPAVAASPASNSVTPAAAGITYTGIGWYGGATLVTTLDVSARPVFDGKHQVTTGWAINGGAGPYLNVKVTPGGANAQTARFGWSTSPTVPPLDDPAFYATNNSGSVSRTNAFVDIAFNGTAWYAGDIALWVDVGTLDGTKFYPFVKPGDGKWVCTNTNGMAVTGA